MIIIFCIAKPKLHITELQGFHFNFRIKYFVEKLVSERTKETVHELPIKWEGFTKPTWEPKDDLPTLAGLCILVVCMLVVCMLDLF